VYSYPAGDMPDWEVPTPIRGPPVVETAGPRAHPVEISDDEVEVVKEVDAPVPEEPAQETHEKPPSAEVPLERVGALERALERVEATRREGAIPSLPRADTQPAEFLESRRGPRGLKMSPLASLWSPRRKGSAPPRSRLLRLPA
jgi:hypothetical protein